MLHSAHPALYFAWDNVNSRENSRNVFVVRALQILSGVVRTLFAESDRLDYQCTCA